MNRSIFAVALLSLGSLMPAQVTLAATEPAGKALPRVVHFSTGYFAPPIELPARLGTLSVSAIELTAEAWTDDGSPARLLLDESRVNFNLFGDATVDEKKGGPPLEVQCERMPIDDPSGEDRLMYHLRLPADTLLDQVYLAVSPHGIGPHRLLIAAKEIPLAPDRGDRWSLSLNHVLPMREARDDAAEGALPAGEAWQPTRISLATHPYWEGPANEKRRSRTQINGLLNGSGHLNDDPNQVTFDPFGDVASSTLMGYAVPPIVLKEMQSRDPAGLGRRLFNLLRDESQKKPFGGGGWPFGRYMLVLYPTRNGPHRLVVRNAVNQVVQVLPLHDAIHQYFERRIVSLKGAEDELRPIEALREILGEGLWFDVKNGHVETLRLPGEPNLGAVLPLAAALKHLKQLRFSNSTCQAQDLLALRDMAGLEAVSFYTFPVSDEMLRHLEGHRGLKNLWIYDPPAQGSDATKRPHVTDAGLKILESLPDLEYLGLSGAGITDAGLPHLAGLQKLKRLEIHHSGVTLAGCFELLGHLPNAVLKCDDWEIDAANASFNGQSDRIDDDLIGEICRHKNLAAVRLFRAQRVTNRGLERLSALGSLTELSLMNGVQLSDEGLRLVARLTKLKHLSLWYCSEVTDAGLEHLAALNDLEELQLGGTKATPAGVEALRAKLPKCKIKKDQ